MPNSSSLKPVMTMRLLFKPCATSITGMSPVSGWGGVAGDKTGGECVFIVWRYGRTFLSASGEFGRRVCGRTIAATGFEGRANVWVMRTGRRGGKSWNQMLRRRAGGFIR
jgi:hypothetical protein